ncbi:MAG: serine--tRNA ligase [Candidatus Parcubacteria bacterium]|nr:serine--tRNA ligase [Candidatus Parcubacteria bacterium]
MLDIRFIRENPELIKGGLSKRGLDISIMDKILEADSQKRKILTETEELRHKQKGLGKDQIKEAKQIKEQIKEKEGSLSELELELDNFLKEIPNLPFSDVPVGKNENENVVTKEAGEKPDFDFKPKDYLEIAQKLDLIDISKASEVAGSRFGYLKNEAVLLEFALIKLVFDILLPKNFISVLPPVMIKPEVYQGMGRLSESQKEERYYLKKDNLYLIGSAEHTLGPLHMNDVLKEDDLPKRYLGFSTCFRREAGSYGKDTKGILRVHQFDKVEMFSFANPENSGEEHKFLLEMQEKIMQALDLPYRVVEICTGDMGFTDARQYDIETWFPGQNKYRETHSCSNTTDFQARGINAKYRKNSGGKTEFVHMLNATAIAMGRTIIAIIENCQQKEGSIKVPEVLQKYLGKEIIS